MGTSTTKYQISTNCKLMQLGIEKGLHMGTSTTKHIK